MRKIAQLVGKFQSHEAQATFLGEIPILGTFYVP